MELSFKDLKELLSVGDAVNTSGGSQATPFKIGESYLIRTVTHYHVGRVKEVIGNFLVLTEASWVQDTGRFSECWKNPSVFKEVEPVTSECFFISLNAIVDAGQWDHPLPTKPAK